VNLFSLPIKRWALIKEMDIQVPQGTLKYHIC
jgi:hypothetical protein